MLRSSSARSSLGFITTTCSDAAAAMSPPAHHNDDESPAVATPAINPWRAVVFNVSRRPTTTFPPRERTVTLTRPARRACSFTLMTLRLRPSTTTPLPAPPAVKPSSSVMVSTSTTVSPGSGLKMANRYVVLRSVEPSANDQVLATLDAQEAATVEAPTFTVDSTYTSPPTISTMAAFTSPGLAAPTSTTFDEPAGTEMATLVGSGLSFSQMVTVPDRSAIPGFNTRTVPFSPVRAGRAGQNQVELMRSLTRP